MPRRPKPATVDLIIAAVLVAGVEAQAAFFATSMRQRLVMALMDGAVCAAVAVRRRYPAAAGLGVQALMVVGFNVAHPFAGPTTIAWFCALYALAVWTSYQTFVIGLVFFAGTNIGPALMDKAQLSQAMPFTAGAVVVMILLRVVVGQRDRRLALGAAERDLAMREAIGLERARIARELHDVIAHHVSMMVVQAGAERRVLTAAEGSTRTVLETIERSGRSALADMRRLLGMLRGDEADSLAPQPRLADIETLVTQAREAGLSVDLSIEGEAGDISTGLDLSGYRIVQEGLTNSLRHAGGAQIRVRVRHRRDAIDIDISDDGTGERRDGVPGAGVGLVGIRERVCLYGGTLDAGPRPEGGFALRVVLPVSP